MKNYEPLANRVRQLWESGISVRVVGNVDKYPVYRIDLPSVSPDPYTFLLTAGVHGDEPAGVEAILRFAERDNTAFLEYFRFVILPCINPTGYAQNLRENRQGVDLNRAFDEDTDVEIRIVKKTLADVQADCVLDFHEDWEADGFYLYERQRDSWHIGEKIIKRIALIGPIATDAEDHDLPTTPGLYPIFEAWGTVGLAPYVLKHHAKHALILETPTNWDMEQRVTAHLTGLHIALKSYLDGHGTPAP